MSGGREEDDQGVPRTSISAQAPSRFTLALGASESMRALTALPAFLSSTKPMVELI